MLPLAVNLAFLGEIVVLFVAAVAMAYLCYRIGLVPIAGFLITGVLIGPTALGLVSDQELVDVLAEVGVILLLFTIGLEFSLEKLSRLARAIFVAGSLQGATVVIIVTGVAVAFGPIPEAAERVDITVDGLGSDLLEARNRDSLLQGQLAGFGSGVAVRRQGLHQLLQLGGVMPGDRSQGTIRPEMLQQKRKVGAGLVLHFL